MFSQIKFVGLLVCLSLLGAATADAVPRKHARPERVQFDLKLNAKQFTRYHYDRTTRDVCSQGVFRFRGAGEQTLVARIPKVRVVVTRLPEWVLGHTVIRMWPRGYRPDFIAPFWTNVKVDRRSNEHVGVVEPPTRDCAEGDPDAEVPTPDCGVRTLRGRLDLLPPFMGESRGLGISLDGPYMGGGMESLVDRGYKHCATMGPAGFINPRKKPVIGAAKLFGPRKVVRASGGTRRVNPTAGGRIVTTVSWNLVFVRRGKAKR